MHLTGWPSSEFEIRQDNDGGARLIGRFPYAIEAELAPGRREVFAPGALEARGDALLLSQHDMGRPLAGVGPGTLVFRSAPDALEIEARIAPEIAATGHGRDALALVRAGLAAGLSPGFRLRPGGERIERRGDAILRTIVAAELIEISIVTRAAYPAATVEARRWRPDDAPLIWTIDCHPSVRWR